MTSVATASPAAANGIKEYQIARMLNFRTECHMMALKELESPPPALRFFAECGNRTFYPDGVEIVCPDPDDEWLCKVVTERKSFDNLELMRPRE